MDKTTERLLLFGGVFYILFREYGNPSVAPFVGMVPRPINAGTGLTVNQVSQMATTAATPTQAIANQTINQEITAQNTAINIAGTAATAVVGSLASAGVLTASVAGPIGAAVGAVILLIKTLISDTHLYANQLVDRYQIPFGTYLINLVNALSSELNKNTLTPDEVTTAWQGLSASWQAYENTMHQLQSTSSDWYIVATQSLNFFDNQYMGVTLPNGKTLGVGGDGQYGDTPNYGMMSSWIDWVNGLHQYVG